MIVFRFVKLKKFAEAYSEFSETFKMGLFAKTASG